MSLEGEEGVRGKREERGKGEAVLESQFSDINHLTTDNKQGR